MRRQVQLFVLGLAAIAVPVTWFMLAASTTSNGQADPQRVSAFLQAAKECTSAPTPYRCLNDLVVEKAPVLGVPALLEGLVIAVERHPSEFAEQCHRAAHYLGEYAGSVSDDVDAAISKGTSFCQFGYFHGVIEGYAMVTPTLYEELPTLCAKVDPDPATTAHAECSHSLGHAVVTRTGNDVPAGIARCRSLQTRNERKACGTGVFMSWSNTLDVALRDERDNGTQIPELLLVAPADRRWEMCVPLDDEMAEACVHFFAETAPVPPLLEGQAAASLGSFAQWCGQAFSGRQDVAVACQGGVGRVAGGVAVFDAVGGWPGIVELCSGLGLGQTSTCALNAYTAAAQFQPDMVEPACAAWAGRPEAARECATIRDIFSKVNGSS
jgi:hypothetical protein